MTDGKARAAEPSLSQGLENSAAREASRRAFCKLFQPARERKNRPVYLDACNLSPVDSLGAFESPTSLL